MGFFGRLFGGKKKQQRDDAESERRRRWSFARSSSNPTTRTTAPGTTDQGELDANKHAIAVAAATAAVAEAALAAAHAAAEVVRLTSGTSHRRWPGEYLAAVKIQSAFRGYLARRALRALKALVKLQALVRGHIVRKQTADMLRRMQTLVRLQARARASRAHMSESFHSIGKSSHSQHSRCASTNSNLREMVDLGESLVGSNRMEHWMEESTWNNTRRDIPNRHSQLDDDKSDKILEVDTWKPHHHLTPHPSSRNYSYIHSFDSPRKSSPTAPFYPTPSDVPSSLTSLKFLERKKPDPILSRSADNSPQVHPTSSRPGTSSRKSPFTPTRSEYSWGYSGNYSGYYPNYMANTESYRAKVRSQSAPRQRVEFDRYGSSKRSVQGYYYFAESAFAQRSSDGRSSAYREASERLTRVPSANLR